MSINLLTQRDPVHRVRAGARGQWGAGRGSAREEKMEARMR